MNAKGKYKEHATKRCQTRRLGFTLLEVVISIVIVMVLATGAMGYQFHAMRQAQTANVKMVAARTGALILENWKGTGGSDAFDPEALDLGVIKIDDARDDIYLLTVDDFPLYFTYEYKDIDTNPVTGVTLRQLHVFVQWRPNGQEGVPEESDPSSSYYTYVRRDQSSG